MIKYFICLSLILLPLVYNVEGHKIEPSPWKPIRNVQLGYYVEIGRYAIEEHNTHEGYSDVREKRPGKRAIRQWPKVRSDNRNE
ncbi:hypothetical protein Bca52824_092621 [Brassica carinata]|uniref:Uncharacterized protein n=1 Tax=Brassica carinata TaxID=52824 RepID=A0A8X7TDL9_BRACI|nr:hypothetical protein Bca52824_092620 [Brassica carinata]KAG2238156.1 hypothetical protein Bca52824_092621 [Brassica carinata]